MNVLFLTLSNVYSINEHSLHVDLPREFIKNGNNVYIVSPIEARNKEKTNIISEGKSLILKPRIPNIRNVNIITKGINTILLEYIVLRDIKKYWDNINFDLVLYTTPPITWVNVIIYLIKKCKCKTFLLLKDIFPQNAVDLSMLKKSGIGALIYKYFRYKEKKLYKLSNKIGCMSKANVDYILRKNKEIDSNDVVICPNAIEIIDRRADITKKNDIRKKYNLPLDKLILVYGGNLGKPQGIPFFIECVNKCKNINNVYFFVIGNGTEYEYINNYIKHLNNENIKLLNNLLKDEYDTIIAACDVGLIFLDYRFTIPNYPSRILSYMQAGLPVIAMTDRHTDIGDDIVSGKFGWKGYSNNSDNFVEIVNELSHSDLRALGQNGWEYLNKKFNVSSAYQIISNNYKLCNIV